MYGGVCKMGLKSFKKSKLLLDHLYHGQICIESFIQIKRDAVKSDLNQMEQPSHHCQKYFLTELSHCITDCLAGVL